eukprot:TRINITY_DN16635_c0_g1_i1.p1 TRINITY_DN16635_c0_g1~~TRINITY_DN16635_c0_g1_i1.p1  ORF type:complete len:237 (+),score=38.46 TRINITY_DN16635_c0_g1_i1:56-712(+)
MSVKQALITLPMIMLITQIDFTVPAYMTIARVAYGVAHAIAFFVLWRCLKNVQRDAPKSQTLIEVSTAQENPLAAYLGSGEDSSTATPASKAAGASAASSMAGGSGVSKTKMMSIEEHDLEKVQEQVKKLAMGFVITGIVHYFWNFGPPLLIQAVMTPLQLYMSPMFKVLFMGQEATGDLARPWREAAGGIPGMKDYMDKQKQLEEQRARRDRIKKAQ